MGGDGVYRGSDGRFYGEVDLWEHLEAGRWRPLCWNADTGVEWVERADRSLLALTPVSRSRAPERVDVERTPRGLTVVARADPRPEP